MDATNAISKTNDLYVAKQRLIIYSNLIIYSAEIRYHRSCYCRFPYRKREEKDVIKQKSYQVVLNDLMKKG